MYVFEKNDDFFQTLHPITILFYLFVIAAGSIMVSNPILLTGFMITVILSLLVAKSINNWLRSLKIYLLMITMLIVINLIINNMGATVLWTGPIIPILGRISISLETMVFGLIMGLRLLIVFSVFILYNRAMDPDKALSIFAKVFPKSALLIALTTKTIPYMSQQLQRVAEIQQCRGVQYHTGSYMDRIKNRLPLIKVLLLSSLEDSFNIGESIQARAYGSGPRSSYYTLTYNIRDIIVLLCSAAAFIILLWSMFKGWSTMEFYPKIGPMVTSSEQLIIIITIISLMVLPVVMAWGWEKWHYLRLKI